MSDPPAGVRARYVTVAPTLLPDAQPVLVITKGARDDASWQAICTCVRLSGRWCILKHATYAEIVNVPDHTDGRFLDVMATLSTDIEGEDPPMTMEDMVRTLGPLVAGRDEPPPPSYGSLAKRFDDGTSEGTEDPIADADEEDDAHPGIHLRSSRLTAQRILCRTLSMFLLRDRVLGEDTVRLWTSLNIGAHFEYSPAPPMTPPIQFVFGRPVFFHLYQSTHPKTRFLEVPASIEILRRLVEVCVDCGTTTCAQGTSAACEEAQQAFVANVMQAHGGTIYPPSPLPQEFGDLSRTTWERMIGECHPGSIFLFSLPSPILLENREICDLCIVCGLRHPDRTLQECLLQSVRNRDSASRHFLRVDQDNARNLQEYETYLASVTPAAAHQPQAAAAGEGDGAWTFTETQARGPVTHIPPIDLTSPSAPSSPPDPSPTAHPPPPDTNPPAPQPTPTPTPSLERHEFRALNSTRPTLPGQLATRVEIVLNQRMTMMFDESRRLDRLEDEFNQHRALYAAAQTMVNEADGRGMPRTRDTEGMLEVLARSVANLEANLKDERQEFTRRMGEIGEGFKMFERVTTEIVELTASGRDVDWVEMERVLRAVEEIAYDDGLGEDE